MRFHYLTALVCALSLAACSDKAPQNEQEVTPAENTQAGEHEEHAGDTIVIKMITDDKGNYFEPSTIEAKEHDVLKFVLASGVHNVHFPAEKNAGAAGLPAASELLQLPGQELLIPITWDEGTYSFQCDPHALLGMVGTLTVKD
jgi:plastocyanin